MTPSNEDWYTVPDCPEYFVSTEGRVIGPLRMVLKPARGTWVTLRHRNGNYIKRKVQDLLQQSMVLGKKVRDPHIMVREKRMPAGSVAPKRKCHDCGRPTPDYRCAHCLSKWREKYGVSPNGDFLE